jgi:hypothetical protein
MVGENGRQLGRRQAAEAAIGAEAERGQIFARDREALRERAHVVDGAEIDARAMRREARQRREKRIVAAVEHRQVDPVDPAAGRGDESVGERDGLAEIIGHEARPAAERAEAEVIAERDVGWDVRADTTSRAD